MAKIKLIFFLFCVFLNAQNSDIDIQRIDELKKLGDSLFKVSNYTDAAKVYKELVQIDPNSFDFNFKYASAFGLEVEQMPRFKQAKNVREMVKLFERAYELDNKNWAVDFGGLKPLKAWLEDNFDHKLALDHNDPHLEKFNELE